jgi:hypothetical protein
MSATGARKQLKDGIIKILSEWLMLEYYGDYEEVAADIMALVPKPEKCVMYKFCPHCARRVIATEDMSLWL